MRKIVMHRAGGPEVLETVEVPDPTVGENQVLVDIRGIGLNWSEVMIRRGEWPQDLERGFTPGAECAGRVEAVGAGVTHVQTGDPVAVLDIGAYGDPAHGTYAEKIAVEAGRVLKIPANMSFAEAAAIPMALLTAYDALINHSPLPESGTLVVTACTGAVGIAALQIGHRKGLKVIGTARTENKKHSIASLGVEAVIDSDPVRLKEKVAEQAGESGVDYIFDPVNGETATQLLTLMADNSTFVNYGLLGGSQFMVSSNLMFSQIKIHGYVVLKNLEDPEKMQAVWAEILPLVETREVEIPVHKTFPFERMAEAHHAMEEHGHFGKLVVVRE